MSTHE